MFANDIPFQAGNRLDIRSSNQREQLIRSFMENGALHPSDASRNKVFYSKPIQALILEVLGFIESRRTQLHSRCEGSLESYHFYILEVMRSDSG